VRPPTFESGGAVMKLRDALMSWACGVLAAAGESAETRIEDLKVGTTLENLMVAYNGESTPGVRYAEFAMKAEAEGYLKVAQLFRATSASEKTHAEARRGDREDGRTAKATIDSAKSGRQGRTFEASLKGETYEKTVMYPRFLEKARRTPTRTRCAPSTTPRLPRSACKFYGRPRRSRVVQGAAPGLACLPGLRVHGDQDRLHQSVRSASTRRRSTSDRGPIGDGQATPRGMILPAAKKGADDMLFPPMPDWDGLHPLVVHSDRASPGGAVLPGHRDPPARAAAPGCWPRSC